MEYSNKFLNDHKYNPGCPFSIYDKIIQICNSFKNKYYLFRKNLNESLLKGESFKNNINDNKDNCIFIYDIYPVLRTLKHLEIINNIYNLLNYSSDVKTKHVIVRLLSAVSVNIVSIINHYKRFLLSFKYNSTQVKDVSVIVYCSHSVYYDLQIFKDILFQLQYR